MLVGRGEQEGGLLRLAAAVLVAVVRAKSSPARRELGLETHLGREDLIREEEVRLAWRQDVWLLATALLRNYLLQFGWWERRATTKFATAAALRLGSGCLRKAQLLARQVVASLVVRCLDVPGGRPEGGG